MFLSLAISAASASSTALGLLPGSIRTVGRLASPDDGDALALTFAYPVVQRSEADDHRIEELIKSLKRRVV